MKNLLKSRLFLVVITAIFFSSVSVFATRQYDAAQITYTKQDNTQTNVGSALNELYTDATTTISDLQSDLNSCNNKNMFIRLSVNSGTSTNVLVSDIMTLNGNSWSKFKVTINSNGANAVCGAYISNGSTKINDLTFGQDYVTNYNNINDYRLILSASTSWCSYRITFHN